MAEEFTEKQHRLLERFVTNTSGNVFALRNLPEVIKGALFSRYSRSTLGLRALLLKEFIHSEEIAFDEIVGPLSDDSQNIEGQALAVKKAQNFYDRILDGYGDDSIAELGGAHLAVENISMIAAKVIEDARIGGSPLEKSTRYIYFDQKVNGEYSYYRDPILMTSAYREEYLKTCNHLFDTYSALIPPVTEMMEKMFPREPNSSQAAYTAALRARVLDCLRGLLPASTLTNMGAYGNGRFWEYLIHKLHCHNLAEIQELGKQSYEELAKVIPSFIRRSDPQHRHHQSFANFNEAMRAELQNVYSHHEITSTPHRIGVSLVDYDSDAPYKIAAGLLFPLGAQSYDDVLKHCRSLTMEELTKIFDAASSMRENRRHRSPRALEMGMFSFEILGDFGCYRDLQRHRMLTQERQLLTCRYGYVIPKELLDTPMEAPYREAMDRAAQTYEKIAQEFPEEAQYVVPMAYRIRWIFHLNLRAIQWLCELRSAPAGHPYYRQVAQDMAKQVLSKFPFFEGFLKFVDYEGYDLGRLGQEERKEQKRQEKVDHSV